MYADHEGNLCVNRLMLEQVLARRNHVNQQFLVRLNDLCCGLAGHFRQEMQTTVSLKEREREREREREEEEVVSEAKMFSICHL